MNLVKLLIYLMYLLKRYDIKYMYIHILFLLGYTHDYCSHNQLEYIIFFDNHAYISAFEAGIQMLTEKLPSYMKWVI